MAEYLGDGIYRIGKAERIWSCRKGVMEASVAEVEPNIPPADARFGWFKGAIPTPPSGGFYVVEFLEDQKVRVLAYVDMYGRAFTTQTGFERPPAQEQSLFIANSEELPNEGGIFVRDSEGNTIRCASYSRSGSGQNAKYTIIDSWYDFGNHGKRLHYYDLMARAYLAFVYRPTLGNATLPFGISDVYHVLAHNELLPALMSIIDRVHIAEEDPLVTVHPIATKLRDRLERTGVAELTKEEDAGHALQLIRTTRYANTFYVQARSPRFDAPTIWATEAAINLFSLSESLLKVLQAKNQTATLAGCEDYLLKKVGTQTVKLDLAMQYPDSEPDGEWQVRSRIAAGIENMELPIRIEAHFALDLPAGIVAFELHVPNEQMFVDLFADQVEHPDEAAKRYAMHVGLLLADIAFLASARVNEVFLSATPIERKDAPDSTLFCASFDRTTYQKTSAFEVSRKGDPTPLYTKASTKECSSAFQCIHHRTNGLFLHTDADLTNQVATRFAAESLRDLEVYFNAEERKIAERLADAIAATNTTTEAVAAVRMIQAEILVQNEGSAPLNEAFTRLLAALTEGTIDPHEQNSTVNCFLGGDACAQAYRDAQALNEAGEHEKAITVLANAIANTSESGRYTDNDTTVYRAFDSFASRMIYNLMKANELPSPKHSSARTDVSKETCLLPDSYVLCLLELASLKGMQGHFSEALQIAQYAVHVTPTIGATYRAKAQIEAMAGDLKGAVETLKACLISVVPPDDISSAYYQLGYALRRLGDADTALLCLIKAIMTSSVVAPACIEEINAIQEESATPLPLSDDVDSLLVQAGIPCAPSETMVDTLQEGAIAALDAGFFDVARSLLTFVFSYRSDDALINIIRSLENSAL